MSLREDYFFNLSGIPISPSKSFTEQPKNELLSLVSFKKKEKIILESFSWKKATNNNSYFLCNDVTKQKLIAEEHVHYRVPFATHWSVRRKWQFSLQNLQHSKKSNPFIFFFFAAEIKKRKKKVRANEKRLSSLEQKSSGSKFSTEKRFFDRPEKKFRTLEPKNPLVPSTEAAEGAAALTLMSLSYKSHFRD